MRLLRFTPNDVLFSILATVIAVIARRRNDDACPPWREARLSVRPGITGLWQVNRTRIRGADFQEWIKYDIEYVENQSWLLDLRIVWKPIVVIIDGVRSP